MVTTGGTTLRDDIMRLQQPVHILVGTPGRILDLGGKGIADLRRCEMFVMDEADKLLSEEFTPVIEQLLALCPQERQVMLFSATFPYVVKDFSVSGETRVHRSALTSGPSHGPAIRGQPHGRAHPQGCDSVLCLRRRATKGPLFEHPLLQGKLKLEAFIDWHCSHQLQINQSIIFCNSTNRVELLAKKITELGYSCFYSHAKMLQAHRNRVFHDFRNGMTRNLVCSGKSSASHL